MKYLVLITGLIFSQYSFAIKITDTKILNIYAQSESRSGAHAVRVNKTIDESCYGRLYINFTDKEIFSTLLAYQMTGKVFSLMYDTNAPKKLIAGHLQSTCRLYSVY